MHDLDAPRLSLSQVAKRLRVHPSTVWRWALHGAGNRRLRTFHIGGRRWVLESDLHRFVSDGQDPAHGQVDDNRRRRAEIAEAQLAARGVGARRGGAR